jgi:hypothetical protein
MPVDWDDIISQFEALQLWALKSIKTREMYSDSPEKMPFFVSHAVFLQNNAEGMLELIPQIEKDRRFQDLRVGIENFIFWIALPDRDDYVVQVWSENPDEYTLCLLDTAELANDQLKTVPPDEVVDSILDYVSLLED